MIFGQGNTVIDSLETVLKTAQNDTSKVNILNSLSMEYYDIGDIETAMLFCDSALSFSNKLDFKKGNAEAYSKKGIFYRYLGNYSEALKNSVSSLKIFQEIGDKPGIASCYNSIGTIYAKQGDYSEALQNYSASSKISQEIEDKHGLASCYINIGLIYNSQGDYSKTLKNYKTALDISKEIGDKIGIAASYINIADTYRRLGKYPEAIKNYFASLKLFEETGQIRGVAYCYNNLGILYDDQKDYPEALKNYSASLKIKKEIGDKSGISSCYINIGLLYDEQNNYPEALENYLAALKISEEIGDKEGIGISYNNIGNIYLYQENYTEANRYLQSALKIEKETGSAYGITSSLFSLGQVSIHLNNYEDARKYLEDGLALSKKIGSKYKIYKSYAFLSDLDSAEGRFGQALADHKMYMIYKDSLFNEENNKQIAQLKIQYETEKKDKEIEVLNLDKVLKEKELARQKVFRNAVIGSFFLLLIVGVLIFRSFRLRKKLEKQQAICQERKRISADLHDDVGSGLSRIMLLTELVKKEAKKPETRKEAEKIVAISNELSSNIDEIVWALNSNNDYVENLTAYIRRYAAEYFENSSIRLKIDVPSKMDNIPISGEHRQNIFYTVKEALHNIMKHAEATEAGLSFTLKHDELSIVIKDNGKGFPKRKSDRFGNGLNNMRNRMKNINGTLSIENHMGTMITLTVPV